MAILVMAKSATNLQIEIESDYSSWLLAIIHISLKIMYDNNHNNNYNNQKFQFIIMKASI